MASRNKRKAGRKPAVAPRQPGEEVTFLLDRERYKEAIKQAKLHHRATNTPESHRLLEQAYYLRAQQLQQGGMTHAAQEVAQHLQDFGITDPELIRSAAELFIALGMSGRALELQGRLESPADQERLFRQAADQAVLHPERSPALPAEIRAGAGKVRAALERLTAGDEEAALAELRDVARSSPFADWRLFVRGLAASYRGDDAGRRAAWDRLDPDRAPARIARAVGALGGTTPGAAPTAPGADTDTDLEALERRVFHEPVLGPLRKLGALVAQDRWTEAVRQLGPLRASLHRIDPALAERLTRVLYAPLVRAASERSYHEGQTLIRSFTKAAEPLAIDPRWNRLWALVWEGPQGDTDEAEPYWRRYLDDLRQSPALRPEERAPAQALVWEHLGRELVDEAVDLAPPGPPPGRGPRRADAALRDLRRRAVACLEEAIRLHPARRETYQDLIDAHRDWDQPEPAAEVARRLLQAIPDDVDTLLFLSSHHFHAERARSGRWSTPSAPGGSSRSTRSWPRWNGPRGSRWPGSGPSRAATTRPAPSSTPPPGATRAGPQPPLRRPQGGAGTEGRPGGPRPRADHRRRRSA